MPGPRLRFPVLVLATASGAVAKRLCRGLQILPGRFDSAPRLHICPDGETGRHKGLKIPRLETAVPVRVRLRAPHQLDTLPIIRSPVSCPQWDTGGAVRPCKHAAKYPEREAVIREEKRPAEAGSFQLPTRQITRQPLTCALRRIRLTPGH